MLATFKSKLMIFLLAGVAWMASYSSCDTGGLYSTVGGYFVDDGLYYDGGYYDGGYYDGGYYDGGYYVDPYWYDPYMGDYYDATLYYDPYYGY